MTRKNNHLNNHLPICESFLKTLFEVIPKGQAHSLHEPHFAGNELAYVSECVQTGWVSSAGKFVERFENELAAYTGAKSAVAVVNGTAALHVGLMLAGVKKNDEVIVPAFSFVATANAVAHCGAVPNFVDVSQEHMSIDPDRLRQYLGETTELTSLGARNKLTGRRVSAIVPMHTFGHPAEMEELLSVAYDFHLPVVEDAAESLGSLYKTRHTGTFGFCGALSFNGNKIITTGGGGALLFNDIQLAKKAKHITSTAKQPHPWRFFHDQVAWNYRMPNLNAALGCAQLERIDQSLQNKISLAKEYQSAFLSNPNFDWVGEKEGNRSNYWLNAVLLQKPDRFLRDKILDYANEQKVGIRPGWTLLNSLPMYEGCPSDELIISRKIEDSLINLPSSPQIMTKMKYDA